MRTRPASEGERFEAASAPCKERFGVRGEVLQVRPGGTLRGASGGG